MLKITKVAVISSIVLMGAATFASACDCEPEGRKNNGWGNGDQAAPGNSFPNNNAENNGNGKTHPNFPGLPVPN